MEPRLQKVRDDFLSVFNHFSPACLQHVLDNRHRMIRHRYQFRDKGCLFFLLSETLPEERRIHSRESLTRFFTGGSGEPYSDMDVYQAPKWLVRILDGESVERYGGLNNISDDFVFGCLDEAIAERTRRKTKLLQPKPEKAHHVDVEPDRIIARRDSALVAAE